MHNLFDITLGAIPETLYMVFASALFAVLIGIPTGIILSVTRNDGLKPIKSIYMALDWFINIFRSLPFVILMMLVFPITRLVVGKIIGTSAAIVPLTISAAPFIARLIENNISSIDRGIVEAAKSMGSSNFQIVTRVLIPEALPDVYNSITITIINLVSYSAMAGLLGGGGLGDIANRYGYQQRRYDILFISVIFIIIIVQIIQMIGSIIAKKTNRQRKV